MAYGGERPTHYRLVGGGPRCAKTVETGVFGAYRRAAMCCGIFLRIYQRRLAVWRTRRRKHAAATYQCKQRAAGAAPPATSRLAADDDAPASAIASGVSIGASARMLNRTRVLRSITRRRIA